MLVASDREESVRDPARIDRILQAIGAVWRAHPDQRLGQELHNYGGFPAADPYGVEDDDTEAALDAAAQRLRPPLDGD